jgi:hypothetical protein
MQTILLRWTATVDILIPVPLQSFPSHSTIASFTPQMLPHITERRAACIGQEQALYVVRLGPWQLAQYNPSTGSLLLRQTLRDADLESFLRQCCGERRTTSECSDPLNRFKALTDFVTPQSNRAEISPAPPPKPHILLPVLYVECYSGSGHEVVPIPPHRSLALWTIHLSTPPR